MWAISLQVSKQTYNLSILVELFPRIYELMLSDRSSILDNEKTKLSFNNYVFKNNFCTKIIKSINNHYVKQFPPLSILRVWAIPYMLFFYRGVYPLPKKTEEGYQVYISRFLDSNPDKFNFLNYTKMFFNISDVRMKTEEKIPPGDIPIFDMSGFTFRHLMNLIFSPALVKKYMKITQVSLHYHFFNEITWWYRLILFINY